MTADDTVTAKPVMWRDGYERVYWQPATSASEALWDQRLWPLWIEWERRWTTTPRARARPVLYRSRTRAERVSRRHVRRICRDTLSRVEIADDQGSGGGQK